MSYGQPIMIQVQPQQSQRKGFNPIIIIVFALIVLVVIGSLYFFLGSFLNPFANSLNKTINISGATNTLHSADSFVDYGIILILIFAAGLDVIYSYLRPNRMIGIFNIIFLIMLGFIWLTIKIPFLLLATGIGASSVFPTLFAFISSGYFVLILAVCLIIGAIFDFRGD